jgi:hypothetical protein
LPALHQPRRIDTCRATLRSSLAAQLRRLPPLHCLPALQQFNAFDHRGQYQSQFTVTRLVCQDAESSPAESDTEQPFGALGILEVPSAGRQIKAQAVGERGGSGSHVWRGKRKPFEPP